MNEASMSLLDRLMGLTQAAEELEITQLLPNIEQLSGKITLICRFAVLIGPLLLLALGLSYYFLAPKEANWYFGYRCYFGMGSPRAWQYTQHLAGLVMGSLGALLSLFMLVICIRFSFQPLQDVVWTTAYSLIIQVILALSGTVFINIWTMNCFDTKGRVRRKHA